MGHPNIWGVIKHMGASKHMGHQTYRGIQTYGVSKHLGASKHVGGDQTYGGIQTYGGCPNIQGGYTPVPTQHKESTLCQTNGPYAPIDLGAPHMFGCPLMYRGIQMYGHI